ncbi:hypothetical protein N7462_004879 [Penicillium macrosclerotiorum]|uniref:uncharacterized protein n=1 Tax=Penicillium macrosclerotiorum TaxID=303699 RepID=UPI0025468216|nr:uncharacterized protein N7462_004879 [Penicillium macrosclerotiorum]KAJ5690487.1 hypothetical protein N7462_004879 [Penicillium macrosclerotiorum]
MINKKRYKFRENARRVAFIYKVSILSIKIERPPCHRALSRRRSTQHAGARYARRGNPKSPLPWPFSKQADNTCGSDSRSRVAAIVCRALGSDLAFQSNLWWRRIEAREQPKSRNGKPVKTDRPHFQTVIPHKKQNWRPWQTLAMLGGGASYIENLRMAGPPTGLAGLQTAPPQGPPLPISVAGPPTCGQQRPPALQTNRPPYTGYHNLCTTNLQHMHLDILEDPATALLLCSSGLGTLAAACTWCLAQCMSHDALVASCECHFVGTMALQTSEREPPPDT